MGTGRRVNVGRVAAFVAGLAVVGYLIAPLLLAGNSASEAAAAAEVRPLVGGEVSGVRVEGLPGVDSAGSWFELVEASGVDGLGNPVRVLARQVDPGRHRAEDVSWFVSLPAVTGLRAVEGGRLSGEVDGVRVDLVLGARIEGNQVVVVAENASVAGDPVAIDALPEGARAAAAPRRAPLPAGVSGLGVRGLDMDGERPRVELGAGGVVTGVR
ncbi:MULTISPECIES: hypothetical protein [unclassified Crossiella]|uniref:hypothetical protein n=1 Tax=unclassified Crossiella TaxID=2620835 RepID=UPI001FFE45FA|nr:MULTISPECIES: hypothetical protein [unclassified Crossiella]MCK2238276.1 hypothetical protein [Crossiella sp. S99.2]MCK2256316.1 hypothetical protein [Crossiella sp. S99.1]